ACKICEKECPPQCIYIIKSEDKKPDYIGKPQFYAKVFDIDISVCMSCQICVEVCPFEAIKMDKEFELSRRERFDALLMRKDDLAKSNDYYRRISPTDAAEVDAKLTAAAEAAAKKKAAAPAVPKPARMEELISNGHCWFSASCTSSPLKASLVAAACAPVTTTTGRHPGLNYDRRSASHHCLSAELQQLLRPAHPRRWAGPPEQ